MEMNLISQLTFALFLSRIGSVNCRLDLWYTEKDLKCNFLTKETDERPFGILFKAFWSYVKTQYCIDIIGTTIQLGEIESNEEDECNSSELRTLEIIRNYFHLNFFIFF